MSKVSRLCGNDGALTVVTLPGTSRTWLDAYGLVFYFGLIFNLGCGLCPELISPRELTVVFSVHCRSTGHALSTRSEAITHFHSNQGVA